MNTTLPYDGPRNLDALADAGRAASVEHPGHRVVTSAVGFGGYELRICKSLPRSARSLASNSGPRLRAGYWLDGQWCTWTAAQVAADQQDWR